MQNLDRRGIAGQQEGREWARVRGVVGNEKGLRGQSISQGVLLMEINTGKLSGSSSYLTSTAEGWKGGKKKGRQTVKGGREKSVVTRTSDA